MGSFIAGSVATPAVFVSTSPSADCEVASLSAGESLADDDVSLHRAQVCARLSNSEILQTFFLPTFLTNLSKVQKQDVIAVIYDFLMLFKDTPTQTNVLQHDIQ